MSWDKACSWANKLVNADDLAWSSGNFQGLAILDSFATPRFAMSTAEGAAWESRRVDICQVFWNESCSC